MASAILCVSSRFLTAAPSPLNALSSSSASRFDIEAPERTFKIELKLVGADKLEGGFSFKTDEGAEIKGKLALTKKA